MSDRNDTSKWKQLAELGAVRTICKSYSITSPDLPIKWIQQRKIIRGAKDEKGPDIRFIFGVEIDGEGMIANKEFPLLTAIEVSLAPNGKNWKLVSATLERNYWPGKPNKENWEFDEKDDPHKIS